MYNVFSIILKDHNMKNKNIQVELELNEKNQVTKKSIVDNWLPRYTGMPLEKFGKHVLLVNFKHYLQSFSEHYGVEIYGQDRAMQAATHDDITIINFGMGSANAATVMDLLTAISPKACLFLGKCGSLKDKIPVGSLLLPIGAIRGEGASNDYLPEAVPALPAFQLQRAVSHIIKRYEQEYFTGTIYTTNRRVWEHDEDFKKKLSLMRATAIDMETATIFVTGFHNDIPTGALLLVSDQPMTPEGIKTENSDKNLTSNFSLLHLKIGMDSLKQIRDSGESVKHLKY
jgi:AMP nucleosidase